MVTLNDYLYSGDTMFKILKNYSRDLKAEAKQTNNEIDLIHANFLIQIRELLNTMISDDPVTEDPGILYSYGKGISASGI